MLSIEESSKTSNSYYKLESIFQTLAFLSSRSSYVLNDYPRQDPRFKGIDRSIIKEVIEAEELKSNYKELSELKEFDKRKTFEGSVTTI
ncbi:15721_t:CDS:2 [Funneliformis geosporum]|uniref:15721_t:CDS:1 n=1 Tax=Funneliformis geosporum TaxID=1117311 RepID=A0A9W4WLB8_9GLOM|nr:15721_t:CDS:2 [Funneliformis geosporum]